MPMRKRFLSILCILSLLLSMMIPGAFAAEGTQNESTVTLQFVYPEDVPQDEVNLSVFKGVPIWYQKNSAATVEDVPEVLTTPTNPSYPALEELTPAENGTYIVDSTSGMC